MIGRTNVFGGGGLEHYSSCRKISYQGSGTSQYNYYANMTGSGFEASTTQGYIEFTSTKSMKMIICIGSNGGGGASSIMIDFVQRKAYIQGGSSGAGNDGGPFTEEDYDIMVPIYTGTYAKIVKSDTYYGGPPDSPIRSNFDFGGIIVFFDND